MFKLIFKQFKTKEYLNLLFIVMFVCAQVYLELLIPDYMSSVTIMVQTEGSLMSDILIEGAKMLVCAISTAVLSMFTGFFVARLSSLVSKNLRTKVFSKIQEFSSKEIKKFSTASLITRSTNDIEQIRRFLASGLNILIKAPIMSTWAIIKILGKSFEWSIATAVAVIILIVTIVTVTSFAIPKFKKMQTLTDNINRIARESLSGIKVVRAYNADEYQHARFEKSNIELAQNNASAHKIMSIISPLMSFVMSALPLSIYWIGAALINSAHATNKLVIFSDMVVFSSYAVQVVMSFMLLVMIFIMLPRATVSAKRLTEVLSTESSIKDGQGVTTEQKGVLEFKNVDFNYLLFWCFISIPFLKRNTISPVL